MRTTHQIVLASTNEDKFKEFSFLFKKYPEFTLAPPHHGLLRNTQKIGLAEKYETYLENSAAKARLVNQGCHYPALADDSGLEIFALDKKPGVHSHRYVRLDPNTSPIDQSKANIKKVLSEMEGKKDRRARFVSHLTLVMEGIMIHAEGTLDGILANAPKGEQGFGYDSIFIPSGQSKTLAEMSFEEKNSISHRSAALNKIMEQMKTLNLFSTKP